MKTQKVFLPLVLVMAFILAACTPTTPSTPVPTTQPAISLNGTGWILTGLNGQSTLPETQVTLSFEGDRLGGKDGCNNYGGTYTAGDGKLSIDKNLISTLMACPEPIMQQAAAYMTALTQAVTYTNDGQRLTLLDANKKALLAFARQSTELGGTAWVVTEINNGKQAVVGVILGSNLTATFGTDGKLSGLAGCNNYFATYQVTGKSLKVSAIGATKKMCSDPAGVMEQEMQFLKALESAASYRLEGNQLELRSSDGALAITASNSGATTQTPTQSPQNALPILP